LDLQTNGTTAISISASQVVTFANQPAYTGGTANGVLYLNGSKVLTSGTALVFDGTNLGIGTASPQAYSGFSVVSVDSATNGGVFSARRSGTAYLNLYSEGSFGVIEGVGTGVGLRFYTNNAERARLDSSGNLLVGTTAVYNGERLVVDSNGASASYNSKFVNSSTSNTVYCSTTWSHGQSGTALGYIGVGGSAVGNTAFRNTFVVGTQTSSALVFNTADAERARIDTDGTFYIKKASNGVHLQTQVGGLNSTALGSFNGAPTVGSNASGYSGIMFNGASFEPTLDGLNVRQSALVDIGSTNYRFKTGHFTGINFPATQVASSDANTLDDYEEGSWTPNLSGSSGGVYTMGGVNAGRYIRIGRMVWATATLQWTGRTTAFSGNLWVTGLPFTSTGNRASGSMGAISYGLSFTAGYGEWNYLIDPGYTSVYIIQNSTTGSGYSHSPNVDTTGLVYSLSIVYEAG
jgi:hypothetical protein